MVHARREVRMAADIAGIEENDAGLPQ